MFRSENAEPESVTTLLSSMCETAGEASILPSAEIKHIPELCMQAPAVARKVISGVADNIQNDRGFFNPVTDSEICLVFCVYAGLGAFLEWNLDWPALRDKGIFEKLCEKYGIFAMDEFVAERYTGKTAQSPEAKALASDIGRVVSPLWISLFGGLDGVPDDAAFDQLTKRFARYGEACFWFGVNYGLYKKL